MTSLSGFLYSLSGVIYFTLGNIDPSLRSKLQAITLLAVFKSNYVKKCGFNAILQPIVDDVKKLESVSGN